MRRNGVVLAALLVGCAAGVAFREIAFPARAANGPTYAYKIVGTRDLIENVKSKNPLFKDADDRQALEEGMKGFGAGGWRYAGCLAWGATSCSKLLFESANGDASPPPARTVTPPAEPPPDSPASHR